VELGRIGAAWYRRPGRPVPAPGTDPRAAEYVVTQCEELLTALYATLEATWVGAPHVLARAEVKVSQLLRAHAAGLTVPPTLLSNDPAACRRFRDDLGARPCAVKPLKGLAMDEDEHFWRTPLTTVLPPGDALDGAELAPSVYQPYVDKRLELRCVVIGDRVFAAALHSQEHPETRHDWRARPGAARPDVRVAPYTLPSEVADGLRALVRGFGLNFASADMILTPAGEHVFLELNPNGQWLWLQDRAGLPLTAALADLLCADLQSARAAA
jgi:glutathione synthase/RimK-type ligase-like ATP-grasp enzyme